MRKRKRRKLSAHPVLVTLIPLIAIATFVTAGASHILTSSGEPKANKRTGHGVRLESAAPLVPPEMLDAAKWQYIIEQSIALEQRQDLINRIDALLSSRGSPLAGLGHVFVEAQERTGVSARLLVGLTAAESSLATDGYLCRTNHNAWGMKHNGRVAAVGIQGSGGWCWWPDWETAIQGAATFITQYPVWSPYQTAHDLKGYCVGNPPEWIQTVEGIRTAI